MTDPNVGLVYRVLTNFVINNHAGTFKGQCDSKNNQPKGAGIFIYDSNDWILFGHFDGDKTRNRTPLVSLNR